MKQDTRDALLRAGKKSFAKHGYDGASVRQITRAARANLGAITYHFGTKRDFYHAVLEFGTDPLGHAVVAAADLPGPPVERVRRVIRAYFNALSHDQDMGRLMFNELVLSKTPPDLSALPIRHIHGRLVQLVMEGQARGEFRDGDPLLFALSILSGPLHVNLVRRALKLAIGFDLDDDEARERVLAHVTEFACAGLAR